MRKWTLLLLFGVLILTIAACGKQKPVGSGELEAVEDDGPVPHGIYQFIYIGDENGKYLQEENEQENADGETEDLLELMYAAGDLWYFNIGENGNGFLTDTASGIREREVTFREGSFTDAAGNTFPYKKEGQHFWYQDSSGRWAVMEKTSQGVIDLILAGKGGSVPLGEAEVGDLVCLGTYEQIPWSEGTEPIFWRVLDKKDSKLLLLSEKLLDAFAFRSDDSRWAEYPVSWKTSSLRVFLNTDFIDDCFSSEEAKLIVTSTSANTAANKYLSGYWNFKKTPYNAMAVQKRKDGEATAEKVFLLSLDEVLHYFGEAEGPLPQNAAYPFSELKTHPGRQASVTRAVASGWNSFYDPKTLHGAWLTRTLCDDAEDKTAAVVYVTADGQLFSYRTNRPLYIRPAMWVSAVSLEP